VGVTAFRANATWRGGIENELDDGRGHSYVIDVTAEEGGQDKGTSGFELGLLALAGCINAVFALVAKRRRLAFHGLRTELEGERPPKAPTYTAVHGVFRIQTNAPRSEVETALALTLKICPIGALFDRAKIPVVVHAIITAAQGSTDESGVRPTPTPAA
jgi:putative redox protein